MDELSKYAHNNLLYTQESLSKYTTGGYHPVTLGDTFHSGRYKVYHKLGWGGYSTVWLAYDSHLGQWVSLKIKTADSSQRSSELYYLEFLEHHAGGDLFSNYIVQVLDSFTHEGPNGTHLCIVFELLGPTVDSVVRDYRECDDELEPETIVKVTEQLLRAIEFIHAAGLGHGDISRRNIAFSGTSLVHATEEEIFQIMGVPETEPLIHLDGSPLAEGLPTQLVRATEWDDWIEEDEEDIRIIDFGESFHHGNEPAKLAQPEPLRLPEIILTGRFDYRVDLWRAGIMIYSLIFRWYPFLYIGEDTLLVAQMIGLVGRIPEEWQELWNNMKINSRHDLSEYESGTPILEQNWNDNAHDQTKACLISIIRGLMHFLPSNRISASQALEMLEQGCA